MGKLSYVTEFSYLVLNGATYLKQNTNSTCSSSFSHQIVPGLNVGTNTNYSFYACLCAVYALILSTAVFCKKVKTPQLFMFDKLHVKFSIYLF